MSEVRVARPSCGPTGTRKIGRDRQRRPIHQCLDCRRRLTTPTGTPFSGDGSPPDVIALAVRWYPRSRLIYADVAKLLAERGVRIDASSVYN